MEQEKVKTKSRSVMSWGQLFIIFATTLCFIYALTLHAKLKPPAELVGYTFRGSQIYRYEGTEAEVKIPSSYAYGPTYEFKGKTLFRYEYQARNFLQEHFAVGSAGYYEFYNQIYTQTYPWVYEYNIQKPTFVEGNEVQVTSMAWGAYENNEYIEKLYVPATMKVTSVRAFEDCPNLTEVYFEDGVEVVGDGIFDGCSKLKKVRLSETTKRIDAYAFFGTGLETITIPKSVKEFHIGTFYGCKSLKTVRIESEKITANHVDVYPHFGQCPLVAIYVPYNALSYYRNTHPWSLHSSIYRAIY